MSQVAETIIFAISRCAQCLLMFQTYHLLCEIREPAKKKWFHVAMFAVAGVLLDVLTRPLVGLTTVTVCIAVLSSHYFFVLYHKPMVQSIAGSIISTFLSLVVTWICLVLSFLVNAVTFRDESLVIPRISGLVMQIAVTILFYRLKELRKSLPSLFRRSAKWVTLAFSILFLVLAGWSGMSNIDQAYYIQMIIMITDGMLLILIASWVYHRRESEKELKKTLELANQAIIDRHRDKEVFPVLISSTRKQLKDLKSHPELADELSGRLHELEILERESREEELERSRMSKGFNSTGSYYLDDMLLYYLNSAADNQMDLNISVMTSMAPLWENKTIRLLHLERLIGNLMRNAFRAIERDDTRGRKMELFMGQTDTGIFCLDLYDSGEPFRPDILQNLGKRGVTTGGTGFGYAEILDILDKAGASYELTEFAEENPPYSKRITISFDGERRLEVDSCGQSPAK